MNPRRAFSAFCLMLSMSLLGRLPDASAQANTTAAETPQVKIVITKHSNPMYPPAARTARITGDVTIRLGVRQDGSVESAEVVSGHPLLAQAALLSAKKFEFECRGCTLSVTPYVLVYQFLLGCTDGLPSAVPGPVVVPGQESIQIVACLPEEGAIIDYFHKVRAARCLYLWKCGLR